MKLYISDLKLQTYKYLPSFLKRFLFELKLKNEQKRLIKMEVLYSELWEKDHNHTPVPHYIKQETIKKCAQKYSLNIFIETGTYLGRMIESIKHNFEIIKSIELSENLALRAQKKFVNYPNIEIIHGDSGEKISAILEKLNQPALFWLDGHFSGGVTAKAEIETPILNEVKKILEHPIKSHVILIDDARLFNGERDYPTHEELKNLISEHYSNFVYEVNNDIIKVIWK